MEDLKLENNKLYCELLYNCNQDTKSLQGNHLDLNFTVLSYTSSMCPGTHTKYKIKPMTTESSRQGTLRHAINKHRAMSLAPWFSECISLSTDPKGSTSGGLISVC